MGATVLEPAAAPAAPAAVNAPAASPEPLAADAAPPAQPRAYPIPLFRFDPGWIFLICGVLLIAATVIIPARHELALAQWSRDRALAIETHRTDRLSRYGAYLKAVESGDESVLLSLAASQLNMSPIDRVPLAAPTDPGITNASVFPDLEPEPVQIPSRPVINERSSMLARWTTSEQWRLWLLAGGTLSIMIGLLPPSTRR